MVGPKKGDEVVIVCMEYAKCLLPVVHFPCAVCDKDLGLGRDNVGKAKEYGATILCLKCAMDYTEAKQKQDGEVPGMGGLIKGKFCTLNEAPGLVKGLVKELFNMKEEE